MPKYTRYMLLNYFDVWDTEDGWEVNNQCVEFNDLHITDDATEKEICEYLKQIGFLNTSDMRRLYVEDTSAGIEIFERKGMKPLCRLQEVIV